MTGTGAAGGAAPARTGRALLAILVVTVIWGWTFVWMKTALATAQLRLGHGAAAPAIALFLALRFGLSALILPVLVPAARRGLDRGAWSAGLVLAVLLLAGFLLQMFGLDGVSAPVSAFLTSLYVLFTALLATGLSGRPPGWWLGAGVLLATFGAGFISGPPQLAFDLAEWLTVGSALVFAVHILVIDGTTKVHAPLAVTWTSFLWVTLGSLGLLLATAGGPGWSALADLAVTGGFLRPLLLSAFFATVLALSLMNFWQRELPPVRAAILYALEPVWAALIALAVGQSGLDGWLLLGGGSLLAGNLAAELGPMWLRRRRGAR